MSLLLLFFGAVFSLLRFTDLGSRLTVPAIREWIAQFDPVLARLIYIGVYILGTVLLLPMIVMSFCGALLFGAYEGTLYTWIGATIGATLAHLLARWLGRDFVEYLLGHRYQELEKRLEHHGFVSLLILRMLPWFPFNVINFGSGLTPIRFRDYVLATAIGMLPGTFLNQFLFAKVGEKVLAQDWQLSDLADPELGLALALFAAFLGLGRFLVRRLRRVPS